MFRKMAFVCMMLSGILGFIGNTSAESINIGEEGRTYQGKSHVVIPSEPELHRKNSVWTRTYVVCRSGYLFFVLDAYEGAAAVQVRGFNPELGIEVPVTCEEQPEE